MAICCPLEGSDGGNTLDIRERPVARRPHVCCECSETIPAGVRYEKYRILSDGQWGTYKTCLSCVEIRDHFSCDGWIFGQLWEDLETNFFPDMRAGGPCLFGLSPEAKARLFEERMAWLEENPELARWAPAVPVPADDDGAAAERRSLSRVDW